MAEELKNPTNTYHVYFTGKLIPGFDRKASALLLHKNLKLNIEAIKKLLTSKDIFIKKNINTREQADKIVDKLLQCGLDCYTKSEFPEEYTVKIQKLKDSSKQIEAANTSQKNKESRQNTESYPRALISLNFSKDLTIFISIICCLYLYFNSYSLGFFRLPLSNFLLVPLIIVITIPIAINIISIKLTFWRIFLQTFLNIESSAYKFFSHGYMVRVIAVLVSVMMSIKILVYLVLSKAHKIEFFILSIALIIFYQHCKKQNSSISIGMRAIREDVGNILKMYISPFISSCLIASILAIYSLITMDSIDSVSSAGDIFDRAIDVIDDNDISWPFRVIVRYSYAFEIIAQQWTGVPIVGKPFYCLYLIVSEGAGTFFAMFLIIFHFTRRA